MIASAALRYSSVAITSSSNGARAGGRRACSRAAPPPQPSRPPAAPAISSIPQTKRTSSNIRCQGACVGTMPSCSIAAVSNANAAHLPMVHITSLWGIPSSASSRLRASARHDGAMYSNGLVGIPNSLEFSLGRSRFPGPDAVTAHTCSNPPDCRPDGRIYSAPSATRRHWRAPRGQPHFEIAAQCLLHLPPQGRTPARIDNLTAL
jgi:hypothetical protein